MNKYVAFRFRRYEWGRGEVESTVLLKYEKLTKMTSLASNHWWYKPEPDGTEVLLTRGYPFQICNQFGYKAFGDMFTYDFEIPLDDDNNITSDHCKLFEAPDDDSAKLIFEVLEYE